MTEFSFDEPSEYDTSYFDDIENRLNKLSGTDRKVMIGLGIVGLIVIAQFALVGNVVRSLAQLGALAHGHELPPNNQADVAKTNPMTVTEKISDNVAEPFDPGVREASEWVQKALADEDVTNLKDEPI